MSRKYWLYLCRAVTGSSSSSGGGTKDEESSEAWESDGDGDGDNDSDNDIDGVGGREGPDSCWSVLWADMVGRIAGLRTAGLLGLLDALVLRPFFLGKSSLWVRWSFKMVSFCVLPVLGIVCEKRLPGYCSYCCSCARTGGISAYCVLL